MTERERVPELDGIRGIAILMVMLHHMTLIQTSPHVVDRFVASALDLGWSGVQLFFVLSGFLITGILIDAKGDPHYFRNFYARRTLRIFPLYYAVVAFSLLVLPRIAHPKMANFARISGDEAWYWTYLSNIIIGIRGVYRHGILDISWSLAIEEQFYIVWPLIVAFCSVNALRRVCYALIVIAIAWRAALFAMDASYIAINVLTPGRLDALAIGGLIAIRARSFETRGLKPALRWPLGIMLVVALIVAMVSVHQLSGDARPGQILGYTIIAIVFGVWIERAASGGSAFLRSRFLRWFGKYSYALYLFHLPIRGAVRDLVYGEERLLTIGGSKLPGQLLFYAISIVLSGVAAYASWHLFEKHFLKMKRYFEPRLSSSRERISSATNRSHV
jgi:peptidoglycan/LPS O-acetylase OafA/YrhL